MKFRVQACDSYCNIVQSFTGGGRCSVGHDRQSLTLEREERVSKSGEEGRRRKEMSSKCREVGGNLMANELLGPTNKRAP